MRILALVKYSMDARSGSIRRERRCAWRCPSRFGDLDKEAVEAAVRLKEGSEGVGVLCFGPPGAAWRSRRSGHGCGRGVMVEDPFDGGADAGAVRGCSRRRCVPVSL